MFYLENSYSDIGIFFIILGEEFPVKWDIKYYVMEGRAEWSERDCHFTYDGLLRLKSASYGEAAVLASNQNCFNEQIIGYDKMRNITGLQHYR